MLGFAVSTIFYFLTTISGGILRMTALNAVIQGILQGLTEFLPVSSSGHLSLFQYFSGQSGTSGIMFSIFLHMGTLLAVFIAFYKTVFELLKEFVSIFRELFKSKLQPAELKPIFTQANPMRRMIFLLVISLIPMIASLFFMDFFEQVSSDNDIIVEGCCFLLTSILLFLADNCVKGHKTAADMKYRDAVVIGTMQAVAPLPGLSRSGSTISAGLMAGLEREFAVAFSFIMGIPPVLGANLMELRNVSEEGSAIPASMVLLGMAAALVFGLLAIGMIKWLVNSEKFRVFAWYTMVLGTLTIAVGVFERLTDHMIQEMILSLLEVI